MIMMMNNDDDDDESLARRLLLLGVLVVQVLSYQVLHVGPTAGKDPFGVNGAQPHWHLSLVVGAASRAALLLLCVESGWHVLLRVDVVDGLDAFVLGDFLR